MTRKVFLLLSCFAILLLVVPQAGFSTEVETKAKTSSKKVEKAKEAVKATEKGKEDVTKEDKKKKTATKSAFTGKVNINTATAEELMQINGIGEALAGRIIEHRKKIGEFKSIEEIKDVKGIGEKKFLKIKDNLAI